MTIKDTYKLPRLLEKEELSEDILTLLDSKAGNIPGLNEKLPVISVNAKLRSALFYSHSTNQLIRGFESIESSLRKEQKGLEKLKEQQASNRVSRLLILSNDGTERFYRQVGFLMSDYGRRILPLIIDCDSKELGKILFGKKAVCKSALVNHKNSVINILKNL